MGASVTKRLSWSLLQTGVCGLVPTTVSHQWWYSVRQRFLLFNTACVTCNARKQPSACLEYRRIGGYPIYFHPRRRPESALTISSFMLFSPPAYMLRSVCATWEGKKNELRPLEQCRVNQYNLVALNDVFCVFPILTLGARFNPFKPPRVPGR